MGLQTFYGKGTQRLLWASSSAASGKILSGALNCLNYCKIFILHTKIMNVAAGRTIQPGGAHADRGLEAHLLTTRL
jgi:hypothetical protein